MEELGGGRLIFIGPKQAEREEAKQASYTRGLTVEDRDIVFSRLPHVVEHSMFTGLGRKEMVSDTGRLKRTDLVAADGDFFSFTHLQLDKGRFFTVEDDARHAKVCVVGAQGGAGDVGRRRRRPHARARRHSLPRHRADHQPRSLGHGLRLRLGRLRRHAARDA